MLSPALDRQGKRGGGPTLGKPRRRPPNPESGCIPSRLSTLHPPQSSGGWVNPPHSAMTLQPGDMLDVQFYKGSIVLRKHQPLTPEQCATLLERSRSQPKPTAEDDAAVAQVIRDVRAQRR